MGVLLGVVAELRQEVRSLQSTVKNMQLTPTGQNPSKPTENLDGDCKGSGAPSGPTSLGVRGAGGGCWECGCNRHRRRVLAGKLEGAGTAGQLPVPEYTGTSATASTHGGSGYIAAKVGGLDSLLLVDSGATLSVIPKWVWLAITKGGSELVGDISAANGRGIEILGKWHTVCQFDSLALVAEFLVADAGDLTWI